MAFQQETVAPSPPASRPPASASAAEAHHLSRLREISSLVNSGGDLDSVLQRIAFAVCGAPPWARSGIMAVNRATGYSELVARYDPTIARDTELPTRWKLETSPSLKVVETRRPIIIEDAQTTSEFQDYRQDSIARAYRSVVILPLGCSDAQGREMVLAVNSPEKLEVSGEELDFLMTAAHLAGIAIDKAKLFQAEWQRSERLRRTLSINSCLLERVLSGASLSMIAGMVGTILSEPLVVLDFIDGETYGGRSPEPESIGDCEWAAALRGEAGRALARLAGSAQPADFREPKPLDLSACGLPIVRRALVEPLQVDSETVGGLVIFPRSEALDDLDRLIAQEAKFALSAQMMRRHSELRREAHDLADLFERLTEGDWQHGDQILSRAARLGVDLSQPFRLLALDPPASGPIARGRAASASAQGVVRSLRRSLPEAFVVDQQAAVFLGVPERSATAAGAVSRRVEDALKWATGGSLRVAVGPLCRHPKEFRAARDHCLRTLTLAAMFDRRGILRQEDFGPFALLLSALDSEALRSFVDEAVGPVEAYDRAHATDLLETAGAFIDQSCRFQTTADRLGIHVSTLRYRLKRLQELFGIDLEEPEARFRLALALRLRAIGRAGADA
ncbi:purine catabolism regulatory protein [Tistlia consotensis]|uniref:Purine catabolism regulatory protein n=1 Tax=Tistlia consotensis USBA 355 TaxID=560819 RepID=A0A1Y6C674_9PROT|nr:helix-turn-helix domain-containing protein [Tistlia consotensis]SMF36500.1 purine catabolism regulatory protein [Tistlia consotensis USBA 355]SNR72015.1 purine catabolism regulatory protein [Tistlia consotensis]